MKYNFDEEVSRYNTASSKWDVEKNELPMSLADMDFKTAPEIIDSIISRASIGALGYSDVTDEWKDSIINWWGKRHSYKIDKEDLIFSTGVIPTISACVNRVTNIGDNILCLTPVYNIFFNSIINHGRHPLESELIYSNGKYTVDFNDIEKKMSHPLTTMMILCNPHNPVGYIWSKEELEKINNLALKHGVVILSDEIHCDLTDKGFDYTPFGAVSEDCRNNSIICLSTSKTFNLAGLQGSIVVVHNKRLRNIVNRALNSYEVAEPNFFTINATITAFTKCDKWLAELKDYLAINKEFTISYLKENIPSLHLVNSHATYLLWIDCSNITDNTDDFSDYLRNKTGLIVSRGSQYRGNGSKFIRINIATQKSRLVDGLNRLREGVENYTARVRKNA